ncbi:hypothetical protein EW146_g2574 [Bondarzewia mesenterica]|uniref:F-box domain-containing protein n=1 Tax=Bondarzewia mesenterica TaxID=1095465 RepID=A0A4S4M0J8_9AGAM|nr:hypothetical protein EW146_g2574 [Bondarzewia mesenterica]
MSSGLLTFPPELLLYILSFLDIPDLAAIACVNEYLAVLATDPILQRTRLLVVAPSRVSHSLFALGAHGAPLRPTVADLVHRGVMKGLGIERRWRMGFYFYSPLSVINYESSVRLQRRHASNIISCHLRRRPHTLQTLKTPHVLHDVESFSPAISRSLLPVMRKLKWSIRRDSLSKMVRNKSGMYVVGKGDQSSGGLGRWIETRSTILKGECERVRLAICPGVKKFVDFYEHLGRQA